MGIRNNRPPRPQVTNAAKRGPDLTQEEIDRFRGDLGGPSGLNGIRIDGGGLSVGGVGVGAATGVGLIDNSVPNIPEQMLHPEYLRIQRFVEH